MSDVDEQFAAFLQAVDDPRLIGMLADSLADNVVATRAVERRAIERLRLATETRTNAEKLRAAAKARINILRSVVPDTVPTLESRTEPHVDDSAEEPPPYVPDVDLSAPEPAGD